MEKNLLEQLKEARSEYDIAKICLFNDGTTKTDCNYMMKHLENFDSKYSSKQIMDIYKKAVTSYSLFNYDFDTIDMNLLLGLIFDANDFDENNKLKEGATPLNDTVRYYTGSIKSYLDNKQTNVADYNEYGMGTQGFISFKQLKSILDKSGLKYTGPESFEELENRILSGEVFDITLSAKLLEKDEVKSKGLKR